MSYIRSGSNPESLYVFGGSLGIEFYWRNSKGEYEDALCSEDDWNGFWEIFRADEYAEPDTDKPITFGSLSVQEVVYDFDNHQVLPEYPHIDQTFGKVRNLAFLIQLKIGDKAVNMWKTTWQYIAQDAIAEARWIKSERGEAYSCATHLPLTATASDKKTGFVDLVMDNNKIVQSTSEEVRKLAEYARDYAARLESVALCADNDDFEHFSYNDKEDDEAEILIREFVSLHDQGKVDTCLDKMMESQFKALGQSRCSLIDHMLLGYKRFIRMNREGKHIIDIDLNFCILIANHGDAFVNGEEFLHWCYSYWEVERPDEVEALFYGLLKKVRPMAILFQESLVRFAKDAGIKVPADVNSDFDPNEYPHWVVYRNMQLGSPLPYASAHHDNAKIIAGISVPEIKRINMAELVKRGFKIGYS
jgi:hypothetical protein